MVVVQQEIQPETETTMSSAGIWGKVAVYGIAALFIGMPLVFGGLYTYDMFDLPKVVFLRIMSLVILGAWLIKVVYSGELQWRRTPLDIPVLAFGLASLLSTVHTLSPNLSLHGEYRRYEGLYTIINYLVLYFFVTNLVRWTNEWRSPKLEDVPTTHRDLSSESTLSAFKARVQRLISAQIGRMTWSFFSVLLGLQVVAGVLVALYGILQHFGRDFVLNDPHGIAQVVSTYGNTNFLAAYLVMVIPIAVSLFFGADSVAKKLFMGLCTLTMVICLFYTSSRAAWLGLAIAIAFLLFALGKRTQRRNGPWLVLLALLLVLPPLANYNFVLTRLESIFSPGQTTVAYRLQWWQSLISVARENPILGTGISTLEVAYPKYATLEYAMTEGKDTFLDKAHNELIQFAVTQGLVGLGTYLLILAAFGFFVFRCWRNESIRRSVLGKVGSSLDHNESISAQSSRDDWGQRWLLLSGLTAGIIAYLVQNEFSFGVIGISSLFWMMTGLVVILGTPEEEIRTIRHKFRLSPNWSFGLSLLIAVVVAVLLTIAWRPFTADQLYKQAMAQFSDGQFDQAEVTYKNVLALNPYQTEYWRGLATTYVQEAQVAVAVSGTAGEATRVKWLDQAVETFNKAAELNPAPFHFFFLGETQEAYGTNKGLLEAYQSYKKAVSLYPYYLYANRSLGEVAYKLKMFDESARAFKMAALLDPQDISTQSYLALDYLSVGRDDEQYSAWQRVVELDPNNYSAYYYLGALEEKRGIISSAVQDYEAFLKITPKPQDQQDYDNLMQEVEAALKKFGK